MKIFKIIKQPKPKYREAMHTFCLIVVAESPIKAIESAPPSYKEVDVYYKKVIVSEVHGFPIEIIM